MRAEKIKRNLSGSERERSEIEKIDECQTALGSDTSAEDMTKTALACQDDTQESKESEADQHMVEVKQTSDLNCTFLICIDFT